MTMSRFRALFLVSALLSLMLSLASFKPISAQPKAFRLNANALALIDEVNALRADNGLPPYQVNAILMIIAQAQADHMAGTSVLSHFDAEGLRPYQRAINAGYPVAGDLSQGGFFSENIYSAPASTIPADVIKSWSGDSIHLATMLSPDLKDIGAGYKVMAGTAYFVLDAGSATTETDSTPSAYTKTPSPVKTEAVITCTPNEDGSIYHIAQKEEALWSIAQAYNMSVDDLKKLNRLSSNDIFEGQKLLIYKPKPGPTITPSPGITFTATFGIPSSTPTHPVTPTVTSTATPLPTPPASRKSGGIAIGIIVLIALLGAGIGAWLGRRR